MVTKLQRSPLKSELQLHVAGSLAKWGTPWWPCGLELTAFHQPRVFFSKCDRMHPSDFSCSLHTGVCRLLQPVCRLQQPPHKRHAVCCSMLHPAYRRNAGRITPVCRLHTLVCSLHTSVWRLRTLVLQFSCRDACSLHASLVWTRYNRVFWGSGYPMMWVKLYKDLKIL